MKYRVFTTEKAEEDLYLIAEYLIQELKAGETAVKQMSRIEQAVTSLEEMPERFHVYDRKPWRERNLRVMGVDNYLVFYIIDKTNMTVTVTRVMYGRRDIEAQLSADDGKLN